MPKLLIVDDDDLDRELARRCLRDLAGVEISQARDGVEALEEIERQRPDVVVTDLRMPRMGGLELVRQLLADDTRIPVILATSSGSERIAVEALKAGAANYVLKSDLQRDLLDTVQQLLVVVDARRLERRALECLDHRETRFVLDNDPALVAPVASLFQDDLARLGFGTSAERTQIEIALMEALSNGMIHGNLEVSSELRRQDHSEYQAWIDRRRLEPPYRDRRLTVSARQSPQEVWYEIEDEGPGFDVGRLPDPTDSDNLLRLSGRGLFLIRTFMDAVEFDERGSRIRMSKRMPATAAEPVPASGSATPG
jgi:CheY-like chemotaxis protein/anti-sigma regulatory factor (Ser/Thr protein kinase)